MTTLENMVERCECCGLPLEIGQIGLCDNCQDQSTDTWTNHYRCVCGEEWEDVWDCCCNDRCPLCGKEVEPYISDDGSLSSEDIERARGLLPDVVRAN